MAIAEFNWVQSLIGGVLIGISSALLFALHGRIAGLSHIFGSALFRRGGRAWRLLYLAGLIAGGGLIAWFLPEQLGPRVTGSLPVLVLAGFLVGYGTRVGNGCTSGHGVCGLARSSSRSLVATVTFMASGMVTVYLVKVLGGGS